MTHPGGMVALEVVQRRKATTRIEKGTKKGQQRDNEARSQIKEQTISKEEL